MSGVPTNLLTPLFSSAASYGPYLYANNLIDSSVLNQAQHLYQACANDINSGNYDSAFYSCGQIEQTVLSAAGNINVYDIRTCTTYLVG